MPSANLPSFSLHPAHQQFEGQDVAILDLPMFQYPIDPSEPLPDDVAGTLNQPALGMDTAATADSCDGEENSPPGLNRGLPRISRSASMPLPSQLGQLAHPRRGRPRARQDAASSTSANVDEVSMELADSVSMIVQTMLQVSPPQVLESAKESFSACTLSVPTASMSAIFTSLKYMNYFAGNMSTMCGDKGKSPVRGSDLSDFDIGEMLQDVGDALGGLAAHHGVDLVLFHGDVGLKHEYVRGDETGLAFAVTQLVRHVLHTCREHDTIELGLFVRPASSRDSGYDPPDPPSPDEDDDDNGSRLCSIEITHVYGPGFSETPSEDLDESLDDEPPRPCPVFPTALHRLLRHLDITFEQNCDRLDSSGPGHTSRVSFQLDRGMPSPFPTPLPDVPGLEGDRAVAEPTLDELFRFIETLRGKKVSLYSDREGSFAHHLTSYLSAWGLDVSHMSDAPEEEGQASPSSQADAMNDPLAFAPQYSPQGSPTTEQQQINPQPASFVIIDDDVDVLRERLQLCRMQQCSPFAPARTNKRPSLANNHRPRSSPAVNRILGTAGFAQQPPQPAVVFVHFTSLSNYKMVKDVMQSILSSYQGPPPEVMIIPKPAGPRRFLTALYNAVKKPVVDPMFAPIATSPMSPGVHMQHTTYFTGAAGPAPGGVPGPRASPTHVHRPSSSRASSDRTNRTMKDFADQTSHPVPPSPLGMHDSNDYFPEKLLEAQGTKPSSTGTIIQFTNGQTAGIYFDPKGKSAMGVTPPETPEMERSSVERSGRPQTLARRTTFQESSRSGQSPAATPKPRRRLTSREEEKGLTGPASPTIERKGTGRRSTPTTGKGKERRIVPPVRVLIVDDNPINRTILQTQMKKHNIGHDTASNGQEAVDKWMTGHFDIILMDIRMPVMDGLQATQKIRAMEEDGMYRPPAGDYPLPSPATRSPYRSSVIIVALTASSFDADDRREALGAGCNDFLLKPVSLAWLYDKIMEWGSIKALQMCADPDRDTTPGTMGMLGLTGPAVAPLAKAQAQAQAVAERLTLPATRNATPSPTRGGSANGARQVMQPTPRKARDTLSASSTYSYGAALARETERTSSMESTSSTTPRAAQGEAPNGHTMLTSDVPMSTTPEPMTVTPEPDGDPEPMSTTPEPSPSEYDTARTSSEPPTSTSTRYGTPESAPESHMSTEPHFLSASSRSVSEGRDPPPSELERGTVPVGLTLIG
ncbi:hypothetical protein HDZ31DRAFT_38259 [Schizophyllum fasciatum]